MQVHLPHTYPLDCSCRLSKDNDLFPFATKGLFASPVQRVLSMRGFNNSSWSKYCSGTTHFSCLCKDTKVIWKILFLLWDKLFSSHLVVNCADCDILQISTQSKLTKAWPAIINKNPYVDLLTEQNLPKQNWQPFNLRLLLQRNFLQAGFF